MSEKMMKKSRLLIAGLLGMAMIAALTLWGCGSAGTNGYSAPVVAQPAPALVTASKDALATPADIKAWIDAGLINNNSAITNTQKLVILSVADASSYLAGHIPGAQLLNSGTEINQTRLEGVAQMTTQTVDGTIIDPVIKRSGIDANTTIVFTVNKGGNFLNAARAYYTFRYWGFPKERLKILNGGDNAWEDAGNALTTTVPVITPSTFSVKNNTNNFQLRSSIGEMIALVDNINLGTVNTSATGVTILDVRGGNPTVYIANAKVDDYLQYANVIAGKTSTYKDNAALIARFATFGVTAQSSMTHVYCASGTRASSTFFILDGLLNWPVTMYDGSWNQWSTYYFNTVTAANNLPAASPWRVDINTPATVLPRTTGALTTTGTTAMTLDPVANAMYSILDPRANQMKIADLLYITPVVTTTTTTPTSGGSAGGGC
jgi:3-mercaptopyruvate sulfurtransferase SseA